MNFLLGRVTLAEFSQVCKREVRRRGAFSRRGSFSDTYYAIFLEPWRGLLSKLICRVSLKTRVEGTVVVQTVLPLSLLSNSKDDKQRDTVNRLSGLEIA